MANKVPTQYFPTTNPAGAAAPLAVYHFKSLSDYLVDKTGNGHTLSKYKGTFSFYTDVLTTGLTGTYFSNHQLRRTSEAWRLAKTNTGAGTGAYTIEFIWNQNTGNGGYAIECANGGESPTSNYLYSMGGTSSGRYYQFNEYGYGSNITVAYDGSVKRYAETIYICATCSADGTIRKIYINGILQGTDTEHRAEKGNSGNAQITAIGERYDQNSVTRFMGYMYALRITEDEFDQAQVTEAWESICGDPIDVQRVPPKVDATPQDTAVWEDDLTHWYNPAAREDTTVSGALDKKPGRQLSTSSNYQAVGAWEDDLSYDITASTHVAKRDEQTANYGSIGAWEDDARYVLSRIAGIGPGTVDANGHSHFLANHRIIWDGFLYEAYLDYWATPTFNSFTGYAKDGYHYTSGVKDSPDDLAPWATEAESNHRGPRQSFPDRALLASSVGYDGDDSCELVIFDLDQYDGTAASLHVWMRFISHSSRYFLQTDYDDYRHSHMKNGVLVTAIQQDTAVGSVNVLDFKLDGSQNAFHHFRTDGHWNLLAGKDITDRNSTSWWNTQSTPVTHSESHYRVQVTKGTPDNEYWVLACGEDPQDPITLHMQNGVAQSITQLYGSNVGEANLNDYWYRNVFLDDNDMLWWSQNTYIYMAADYYKDNALIAEYASQYSTPARQQPYVNLGTQVYWLTGNRGSIYAGTAEGVYRIDKNTLEYWLCYTVSEGGGGGRLNNPPDGEILPGAISRPYKIYGFDLYETGFLTVCTNLYGYDSPDLDVRGGSAALIRTYDDKVIDSWQYGETSNDLTNDGAYIALPLFRKV